ncbi:MAG: haloalkane dehalogenase [Pseudomonadota bacterium]
MAEAWEKRFVEIMGRRMAYVEMGEGPPIVFQHGNPTSSYLWRNILPHLADLGRCIAVDLIGMGDSDKLKESGPEAYRFVEHAEHLDAAWAALGIDRDATFVLHDWGSALGFHWAARHPAAVRAIAYMEAIVAPLPGWDDWPENAREVFQALRAPAGEAMILENNMFVEAILPAAIQRQMSPAEMDAYRAPFATAGEDRRPTLTWPRQIPISGEPADVAAIVAEYQAFMARAEFPKLFINAHPGSILVGPQREICRAWPNQTEVTVPGLHFIQEDSPAEITTALRNFVAGLD